MGEILKLEEITKYYNNLHILDKISLQINDGEFISFIGPSGCGKTTLLKIIAGLVKPTGGKIEIKNKSVDSAASKGSFGLVFQDSVLLPWRNVIKNIELPLEILKNKKTENSSKDLLRLVGLEEFESYYPNQLSSGMQQRVAIARALIFEPPIMLMDEPFGALDDITRNYMGLELLKIWQNESNNTKTIIFVTHSISEAVFLSNRVIILSKKPTKIKEIININLPYPRKVDIKSSKTYLYLMEYLRKKAN